MQKLCNFCMRYLSLTFREKCLLRYNLPFNFRENYLQMVKLPLPREEFASKSERQIPHTKITKFLPLDFRGNLFYSARHTAQQNQPDHCCCRAEPARHFCHTICPSLFIAQLLFISGVRGRYCRLNPIVVRYSPLYRIG